MRFAIGASSPEMAVFKMGKSNNIKRGGVGIQGEKPAVGLGRARDNKRAKSMSGKTARRILDDSEELVKICKADADNEALGLILVPAEQEEATRVWKYGELSCHRCVKHLDFRPDKKDSNSVAYEKGQQLDQPVDAEGKRSGRVDWLIGQLSKKGLFGQHFGPGVMPPVFIDYEGRNYGFAAYIAGQSKIRKPLLDFPDMASLKNVLTEEAIAWFDLVGMVDGEFLEGSLHINPGPREFFRTGQWTVGEVREDAELIWHVNFKRLAVCFIFAIIVAMFYGYEISYSLVMSGETYVCSDKYECDELYIDNLEMLANSFEFDIDYGCVSSLEYRGDIALELMREHFNDLDAKATKLYEHCIMFSPVLLETYCQNIYYELSRDKAMDSRRYDDWFNESMKKCRIFNEDSTRLKYLETHLSNFWLIFALEVCLLIFTIWYSYVLTDESETIEAAKASYGDRTKARNVTITVLKYIHATRGVRHTSHSSGDIKSKQILAKVRVESHVELSLWNWSSFHPVYSFLLSLPLPYSTRRYLIENLKKARPHANLQIDSRELLVDLGFVCQLLDPRVLVPGIERSAQRLRIQCKAASMTTHQNFSGDVLNEKDLFTNSVFLAEQLARKSPGSAPLDF